MIKILKNNPALVLIFLLGLFLRLLGTWPGYAFTHPDEPTIKDLAQRITFHLNFEPHAYYYGSLLSVIYGLVNCVVFLLPIFGIFLLNNPHLVSQMVGPQTPTQGLHNIALSWEAYNRSHYFYEYFVRFETAVLSSFVTVVTYFLGKKLFGRNAGLVAAFFVAINYRHVLSSHFILADAPAALFAVLAVFLIVRILDKPSINAYLWAGLGIGLALSVKYFIYILPAFVFCHLFSCWSVFRKHRMQKGHLLNVFFANPVFSVFVAGVTFVAVNPYLFLKPEVAMPQLEYNSVRYGFDMSLDSFRKPISWYPIYYLYEFGFGRVLSFFMVIGAIYSALRYFKQTLILASVLLPFFYFFLVLSGSTHGRNYSAIVPFLLFFPGVLISDVTKLLIHRAPLRLPKSVFHLLLTLFALAIGFQQLRSSYQTSLSFSQTRNADPLFAWVLKDLPEESRLAHYWGVPFPPTRSATTFVSPDENEYQSVQELLASDINYALLGTPAGSLVNGVFWMENDDLVKAVLLDSTLRDRLLEDTYTSLLTREIGHYRVAEFKKDYRYSLDPGYFIAKIPNFPTVKPPASEVIFEQKDVLPLSSDSDRKDCNQVPKKFVLNTLNATEGRIYGFMSNAHAVDASASAKKKDAFLRINFLDKDKHALASYVSALTTIAEGKQVLMAIGPAPDGSTYVEFLVQINSCQKHSYIFEGLVEYVIPENEKIFDETQYPYFNIPLQSSFLWLPHL